MRKSTDPNVLKFNRAHGYEKTVYKPVDGYITKVYKCKSMEHMLYEPLESIKHFDLITDLDYSYDIDESNTTLIFKIQYVENDIQFFSNKDNYQEHYDKLVELYARLFIKTQDYHRLAFIRDPSPFNVFYSDGRLTLIDESKIWYCDTLEDWIEKIPDQLNKAFNQIRNGERISHSIINQLKKSFLDDIMNMKDQLI